MNDLDRRKLIENNQRLVWYYARRYQSRDPVFNYEDFVQIGMVGLVKAAKTYDIEKGNTFATYASRCIINELNIAYRRIKKYIDCISLQEYIPETDKALIIQDLVADEKVDIENDFLDQVTVQELLNIIINMKRNIRTALLLYFDGKNQRVIAKKLGLSQSYVSRMIDKGIGEIQRLQQLQLKKEEKYQLKKKADRYLLTDGKKQQEAYSFEEIVHLLDEWNNLK